MENLEPLPNEKGANAAYLGGFDGVSTVQSYDSR